MSNFEESNQAQAPRLRKIIITCDKGKSQLYVENNLLNRRYLVDCFPRARTLTYQEDGIKTFVQTDEENCHLVQNVSEYEVVFDEEGKNVFYY